MSFFKKATHWFSIRELGHGTIKRTNCEFACHEIYARIKLAGKNSVNANKTAFVDNFLNATSNDDARPNKCHRLGIRSQDSVFVVICAKLQSRRCYGCNFIGLCIFETTNTDDVTTITTTSSTFNLHINERTRAMNNLDFSNRNVVNFKPFIAW